MTKLGEENKSKEGIAGEMATGETLMICDCDCSGGEEVENETVVESKCASGGSQNASEGVCS